MAVKNGAAKTAEKTASQKPENRDPMVVLLEELSSKMDGIVDMVKEDSDRISVLESRTEVLQDMMREEAPVVEEFSPIAKTDYPDAVLLAIAKEQMRWHPVVPLRSVDIEINGFVVPFRKGVRMEIPTSYRDDAVRRGEAQENPIL